MFDRSSGTTNIFDQQVQSIDKTTRTTKSCKFGYAWLTAFNLTVHDDDYWNCNFEGKKKRAGGLTKNRSMDKEKKMEEEEEETIFDKPPKT